VPLRFPRPVATTAAIGLVVAWTAFGSVPAFADQVRQNEWWLGGLQITQAQQTTQGSGVTIALLDTGVDPHQSDLSGSVISGPDCVTNATCGSKPSTFAGIHGTAMASLIVGHGHGSGNSDGILGVAPAARLLSVRVTVDSTSSQATEAGVTSGLPDAIAAGIRYAVSAGAQVIDLPLDPGQSTGALVATAASAAGTAGTSTAGGAERAAAGGSAAESSAVAMALSKGVILVAPAGDNGAGNDDQNFPAAYKGVIAVGAFDKSFVKASFTSQQSYVTLTAAGSGMTAATPTGYTSVSSTAAASAVVTGIAALIKAQYPEFTPAQVTQALTSSTRFRSADGSHGSGHGAADAAAALTAAGKIAKGLTRAGAGSVTRSPPATPPVPFVDESLAPRIERDAFISLAVLIVLLLPIGGYALMLRRRRHARALARSEREQANRASRGPAPDTHADQMLEYFTTSAPVPQPPPARGSRSPASTGGAQARGTGYARSVGSFVGSGGPPAGAFGGPPAGTFGEPTPIPRAPLAPMRASAARPKVTGTPPWEPAPKPESELPWATSPAPAAAARRAPVQNLSAPPSESIWRQTGEDAQEAAEGDGDASRPIYVWNPSANTDTFPSVPRDSHGNNSDR
jgi:subtilisin family serine protease